MGHETYHVQGIIQFSHPLERDLYDLTFDGNPLDKLNPLVKDRKSQFSQNEQRMLFMRYRGGDKNAELTLLQNTLPLLNSVAQSYRGMGIEDEELFSLSLEAVRRTIEQVADNEQFNFKTYRQTIRKSIQKSLNNSLADYYDLHNHQARIIFVYFRAQKAFAKESGRNANYNDLNKIFKIISEDEPYAIPDPNDTPWKSDNRRKLYLQIHERFFQTEKMQIEPNIYNNDYPTESAVMAHELKNDLSNIIENNLGRLETKVLKSRYGLEETQKSLEEVARDLDVTRERVRKLENQAIHRLRHPEIRYRLEGYGTIAPEKSQADQYRKEKVLGKKPKKPVKTKPVVPKSISTKPNPQVAKPLSRVERVSSQPQFRVEDLSNLSWNERTFSEYVRLVSQGELRLIQTKEYPNQITLPQKWHGAFNELREEAINEKLYNAFIGSGGRGQPNIIRLINTKLHTDRIDPKQYLDLVNNRKTSWNFKYYIGDIQGPIQTFVTRLAGIELDRRTLREPEGVRIRQIYRFLSDKSFPLITAKSHHEWNFLIIRGSDTRYLNPESAMSDFEIVERAWEMVYNSNGRFLFGVNELMAREANYNFALYYGRPGQAMFKAK